MKLLLDQNLSWRLVGELQDLFPESSHVREAGMDRAADDVVWEHAKREGFMILSKDSDFQQRSLLYGAPPKCIWLRIGNCSTNEIGSLIRRHAADIREFANRTGESFLVLP
jgi:predicted nuclease of predicted toxin-antitoxin system